jgi:ABC-type glycerol-3-phosphate transport system permease component
MDGCGSFRTLVQILLPLCKPAIFSVVVFQFVWMWSDFFNALIYISSVRKFPIALGLPHEHRHFVQCQLESNIGNVYRVDFAAGVVVFSRAKLFCGRYFHCRNQRIKEYY